eukprot:TRINITY_DN5061_c0_g1_i2.p1 TRINITY_DN5061_c0_g1~~TRINITY_DN5061_c0_g1_i2.p1  ORF type:complete len:175 (+),score=46.74 TRINITY_DN5061_c0_g1_i2:87-611(+)
MSLSGFFLPQKHKTRHGFYLNHDNLMLATEDERKRLILYFILSQVPEKIDPEDREFLWTLKSKAVTNPEKIFSISCVCAALLSRGGSIKSRIKTHRAASIALKAGLGLITYYFASSLSFGLFESYFVAHNPQLGVLGNKYNFTVYDFAQAKKESILRSLSKELTTDSNKLNYSA